MFRFITIKLVGVVLQETPAKYAPHSHADAWIAVDGISLSITALSHKYGMEESEMVTYRKQGCGHVSDRLGPDKQGYQRTIPQLPAAMPMHGRIEYRTLWQ